MKSDEALKIFVVRNMLILLDMLGQLGGASNKVGTKTGCTPNAFDDSPALRKVLTLFRFDRGYCYRSPAAVVAGHGIQNQTFRRPIFRRARPPHGGYVIEVILNAP